MAQALTFRSCFAFGSSPLPGNSPPSGVNMSHMTINEIMLAVAEEKIGMIKASALIEERLHLDKLSYSMQINPRQVGFDPCNRDGIGGNALEILPLAHSIAFAGFDPHLCSHAVCVETSPFSTDVEAFNVKLASGGHLAPVVLNSIRFGSLSCGHNNMGLRAIAAKMPTESVLLGRGGFCDVEHLRERDPEYANAVDKGLTWLVLKSEVRTLHPEVLPLIQVICVHVMCHPFGKFLRVRLRADQGGEVGEAGGMASTYSRT